MSELKSLRRADSSRPQPLPRPHPQLRQPRAREKRRPSRATRARQLQGGRLRRGSGRGRRDAAPTRGRRRCGAGWPRGAPLEHTAGGRGGSRPAPPLLFSPPHAGPRSRLPAAFPAQRSLSRHLPPAARTRSAHASLPAPAPSRLTPQTPFPSSRQGLARRPAPPGPRGSCLSVGLR